MIDFRYHLVSLISVFLALAVGIALGAGPLEQTIGDTLTGQVDQLRTEKEELRTELDATTAELARSDAAFAAAAPAVLDGVLEGRRVALVQVDEVSPEVREQVAERLVEAGASVTATVQVTDLWTDPDQRSFRQGIAGTLVQWLDPVPAEDAGTGTELAEALAQSLTAAAPTDPDVRRDDAVTVLDLLVESGLVVVEGDLRFPADAIVVLAGPTAAAAVEEEPLVSPTPTEDDTAATERAEARLGAAMQIVTASQARSTGAVVAGGEAVELTLVQRVRQDDQAQDRVSTVGSVHTTLGQVSVPLALSARLGGVVGHYGPGLDAGALLPPHVVLPPIVRVPQEPVDAPPDATAEPVDPGATTPPGDGQG